MRYGIASIAAIVLTSAIGIFYYVMAKKKEVWVAQGIALSKLEILALNFADMIAVYPYFVVPSCFILCFGIAALLPKKSENA